MRRAPYVGVGTVGSCDTTTTVASGGNSLKSIRDLRRAVEEMRRRGSFASEDLIPLVGRNLTIKQISARLGNHGNELGVVRGDFRHDRRRTWRFVGR